MATFSNALPFALGSTATDGVYAANVGQLYKTFDRVKGERIFRLVKNGAVIMLSNAAVISAVSSGRKTWVVTTTLAGANSYIAGVVPEEYTATIAVDAYFLLQVGGNALVLAGDTVFSSLTGVESRLVTGSAGSGYARQLAAFTTASTTEDNGVFALASNTAVATAAGATVRVLLKIALDS